jgi:hypothetical protein
MHAPSFWPQISFIIALFYFLRHTLCQWLLFVHPRERLEIEFLAIAL